MRTAVVRVDVDPAGALAAHQLTEGMRTLTELAAGHGAQVVDTDLAALPPSRRQVEILVAGDDADAQRSWAMSLCDRAFGVLGAHPTMGVLTYVSRGTDDDAHGVLAGLGLRGEVARRPTDAGWDVVTVTLRRADLTRVPESRVHTALEASLNCEVVIVVV
ncbi:hypothetical protein MMAD_39160 [Mycolicibacterium madagascariense]|uniref:Uncharacterized protein n=1 Tax=Mycolicibacterium madagascariense TaxID=212765 RepID=A0A7I7XK76_9MYCO|nr:hypothetical protein [Mycolicibacterium madagascariense]MCV7012112.1 hypothetical protein [Mycolicibacterium madagascariense]BBZ29621.1 hypothetical protein MMAD_39160 [Mycolicibacterium madagascariense]